MDKKINRKSTEVVSKINPAATQRESTYDNTCAKLTFAAVGDNQCSLSKWQGPELKSLIQCFQKMESVTWLAIKKDSGFNYESVQQIALKRPDTLPPDVHKLDSIRVTAKSRLYGYRTENFFNIIWFDKNHEVCPMGNKRRHVI